MPKYLGLDLGSRTCGVAISDVSGFLARVKASALSKTICPSTRPPA